MVNKNIERVCKEYWLIENYELAINDSDIWECHHRIEVSEDGQHTVYSKKDLIERGLYFDRQPEELIFITKSEHHKLHKNTIEYREKFIGREVSDATRKKMSEAAKKAHKRENNGFYGKHQSEETKRRISEKMKEYFAKKRLEKS